MANIHIAESTLSSIAEAIREKWWLAGSMHASEMVGWLTSIKSTGDYRNIKNSSYLTFPELKSINTMSMFGENLISISLPNCSYIGSNAFAYCTSLTSISIPNCSYIGDYAFSGCTSLSYISLPNCSYIGNSAFCSCSSLTNSCVQDILDNYKSYSNVLNYGVFQYCSNITSLDLTGYTSIGSYAFAYCTSLTSISIPNCSYIGSFAFYSCAKLTNSNIQDILNTYKSYSTVLNSAVFAYCSGITSLDLTGYTSIGNSAFAGCTLSYISIPNCSYIGEYTFYGCTKLESIYILSTSIPILSNYNAFTNTPISNSTYLGYFGSIYVLSSLLNTFKTATNWSRYSARITAYTP